MSEGDQAARYLFARRWLRGGRLLDLGCGHGLGALLVDDVADSYLGVDVDDSAITWASANVRPIARCTCQFYARSLTRDDSLSPEFDVVTAFEVIEHVTDPTGFVDIACSMLGPGGSLLVSTPFSLALGRPNAFRSPFHLREFSAREFLDLVRPFSASIRFFKQARIDRLDVRYYKRWVNKEPGERARATGSAEVKPGIKGLASRVFHRYLNTPYFWSFREATESEMLNPDYTTSLAVLLKT